MNSLDQALHAFGEDIGMPGLALGARGNVALQLESGRRVAIEPSEDEVLVYVSDPVPYDEQVGLPRLLAATRLAAADASALRLKQTVDYLSRWLDAARDD